MKSLTLILSFLGIAVMSLTAQVKIGNNPNTINSNSLLELESTNKGLLLPRVAINSLTSASPLTAPVPAGMLVYSSGGTVTDGYYIWNGTQWVGGTSGNQPNAMVSSSTSQFASPLATERVLTFETNEHINLITHSTPSRIGVQVAGTYFISFSAQLSGGSGDIDIWLRQNGVNVPRSNTRSSLQNAGDYRVITVTFLTPLVVNDYIELVLSSTNTTAGVVAVGAGTNPTRPSIPSLILTIEKISN